jgi:hypothetical protein
MGYVGWILGKSKYFATPISGVEQLRLSSPLSGGPSIRVLTFFWLRTTPLCNRKPL